MLFCWRLHMNFKEPYVVILEECIVNELLPVYNRYFQEKNLDPPALTLELFKVLKPKTAALLQPKKEYH